jgi:hypothetical protein
MAFCETVRGRLIIATATVVVFLGPLERRTERARAGKVDVPHEVEEVIFAVREPKGPHWYENFGYFVNSSAQKAYGKLGQLCKLNLATKTLQILLDDPDGSVRDPQLHYDGARILFSYRVGGTDFFHLYEIGIDGTGLTKLTDGPWDDLEPTYVPDGGIVFCSSRSKRWVPCWKGHVATLHRCEADGSHIRMLSSNIEQDNSPWVLSDGRIVYTRWEYVDRSREDFHQLWAMNPDGTNQMTFFGNMHPRHLLIDAKPIPGTSHVVAVQSPNHGQMEHQGFVVTVDTSTGPDTLGSLSMISPTHRFARGKRGDRDPYPLSAGCFLVANGPELSVMDRGGNTRLLYRLPAELVDAGAWIHEPRPVVARKRETVIPPRSDLTASLGQIVVQDVYIGRNMEGVKRGAIKKLLILENLPKPVNFTGSMDPISFGGSYTLNRVLGTVPVESDGSVNALVPPLRSLQLIALDENDLSVKRMLSFMTVMPGEVSSCIGCHEQRTTTHERPLIKALRRPPSAIQPVAGMPDVFDYPRDIQPIWDRYCLDCHDTETYAGRVLMTGDRGPMFTHSYFSLSAHLQMADGRDLARGNYPPYTIGSAASYLLNKVDGSHYDVEVSGKERRMIKLWIDAAATFPGTYAALGSGMIGPYAELQYGTKPQVDVQNWPSMLAAKEVLEARCGECHEGDTRLPSNPKDTLGLRLHHLVYGEGKPRYWDPPWVKTYGDGSLRPGSPQWLRAYGDPRLRFSRHKIYNLTRPEHSIQLLAPLAKSAGGLEVCGEVFASREDPAFQILLAAIGDAKAHLDRITYFSRPDFRPEPEYVREMVRYGILPSDFDITRDAIDVYETDRRYWRSMWHTPMKKRWLR